MSYLVVPVLGAHDTTARVLILDTDTGASYALMTPEGPPIPGALVELEAVTPAAVEAAAASLLATETHLHPDVSTMGEADGLTAALQIADRMLTGPLGRVPRDDLDSRDAELITALHRLMWELRQRTRSLPNTPVSQVAAAAAVTEARLDQAQQWLAELGTRQLRERDAELVEAEASRGSLYEPLRNLGLPRKLLERLEVNEVYTLEDLLETAGGSLPPMSTAAARRVLSAVEHAGAVIPDWLREASGLFNAHQDADGSEPLLPSYETERPRPEAEKLEASNSLRGDRSASPVDAQAPSEAEHTPSDMGGAGPLEGIVVAVKPYLRIRLSEGDEEVVVDPAEEAGLDFHPGQRVEIASVSPGGYPRRVRGVIPKD